MIFWDIRTSAPLCDLLDVHSDDITQVDFVLGLFFILDSLSISISLYTLTLTLCFAIRSDSVQCNQIIWARALRMA